MCRLIHRHIWVFFFPKNSSVKFQIKIFRHRRESKVRRTCGSRKWRHLRTNQTADLTSEKCNRRRIDQRIVVSSLYFSHVISRPVTASCYSHNKFRVILSTPLSSYLNSVWEHNGSSECSERRHSHVRPSGESAGAGYILLWSVSDVLQVHQGEDCEDSHVSWWSSPSSLRSCLMAVLVMTHGDYDSCLIGTTVWGGCVNGVWLQTGRRERIAAYMSSCWVTVMIEVFSSR